MKFMKLDNAMTLAWVVGFYEVQYRRPLTNRE